MAFLDEQTLCLGYTPTDYVLYSLATRSSTEVVTPVNGPTSSTSIGGMGMGALSGLGGYIGLGAKAKPSCFKVNDQEGFIAKESKSNPPFLLQYCTKFTRYWPIHWHGWQNGTSVKY